MRGTLPVRDGWRARSLQALVITLTLCVLFESCGGFRLVDLSGLDGWLRDVVLVTALSREQPRAAISLAAIDDASLRALGRWPWDWEVHTRIVEALTRLGARVIAFDVVMFSPPGTTAPAGLEKLAAAIGSSGRVVLAAGLETGPDGSPGLPLLPHPRLQSAARACAWVLLPLDPDGVVRRFTALPPAQGPLASLDSASASGATSAPPRLPFFDLQVAALQVQAAVPERPAADETLRLEGTLQTVRLPLAADRSTAWIRFQGREPAFPAFSCIDLLEGRVPESAVKHRTVLVGYTAELLQDRHHVPASALSRARMPGVLIHAHSIATLLDGRGLAPMTPLGQTALRCGATILAGLAVAILGPLPGALVLGLLLTGTLFGAALACRAGLIFELSRPLLLPVLAHAGCLSAAYFREARRASAIRGMFAHYVNDSVVEMLVREPHRLRLGGEKKVLTVLFSDVRGFTTLSEKLGPEALVKLLNAYLTEMTNLVFEHQGTLDKYIGDALMAIFGAPVTQPDHAARCCRAALRMMAALEQFNARQQATGGLPIAIGIGINTGEMIVGNMGSEARFDFTVMGDAVNLASRLEGQTKSYGVGIIVGDESKRALGDAFVTRELDLIRVKGKYEPVRIHQLVSAAGSTPDDRLCALRLFEQGLACYRRQDWTGARSAFRAVLEALPADGPSKLFLERCAKFEAAPPPGDWDGVFVATTK